MKTPRRIFNVFIPAVIVMGNFAAGIAIAELLIAVLA